MYANVDKLCASTTYARMKENFDNVKLQNMIENICIFKKYNI